MSVERRHTKSGGTRYDVRLRSPDGKQLKRSFRTRREADRYEREELRKLDRGTWTDPSGGRTPFSELAEVWLASNRTKRASTIARDRQILDTAIIPTLGDKQVAKLSTADVQGLVNAWTDEGKAASTIVRRHSALRAVLNYAVGEGLVTRNVALPRAQSRPHGVRLPKPEFVDRPNLDADALGSVAEAMGEEWAPFLWLGALLGLRWGEAAGLTVGNVDLAGGVLHVRLQLDRDGQLRAPKTRLSRRSLTMPESLIDDLRPFVEPRRPMGPNALLFMDRDGGPLDYNNWRTRVWVPAVKAAGLPKLRYHDLRSTAATALVASGADVKTVQARLGHSNPRTTLGIYARVLGDRDRAAAVAVESLLRSRRLADLPEAVSES